MPAGHVLPPEQSSAQMLFVLTFRHEGTAVTPGEAPQLVPSPAGLQNEVQTPSSSAPLTMQTRSSVHSGLEVQCDHQLVSGWGGSSTPVLEPSAPPELLVASAPSSLLPSAPEVDPSTSAVVSADVPPSVSPPLLVSLSPVGASVVNAPVVSSELPPAHAQTIAMLRSQRRIPIDSISAARLRPSDGEITALDCAPVPVTSAWGDLRSNA